MKKQITALVILTVVGLGVIHGRYKFLAQRPGTDSSAERLSEALNNLSGRLARFDRTTGESAPQPARNEDQAGGPGENTPLRAPREKYKKIEQETVEQEKKSAQIKCSTAPYKPELDRVDELIIKAVTYNWLGEQNVEKRQYCARKVLQTTAEALDILDPLIEKHSDKPDIEERHRIITILRQDAVKKDGAR